MTKRLQQKMEMLIYNLLADQVSCDNGLGQTVVCKWT